MDIAVGGLTIAPIAILMAVLAFAVHVLFAIGVSTHAKEYSSRAPTWFVGRFTWFIATLLGGVPFAAIYWVMHCSTLSPFSTPKTFLNADTSRDI